MKKHINKILYITILGLVMTILFIQNIVYVRVIDNAIIFGVTTKPSIELSESYLPKDLDAQLLQNEVALAEADELIKDARC